jgi:indolepyruvate ferredoxin oxidoreductase
MSVDKTDLGDKWSAQSGRFYMTGTQALVKLLMMQAERDKAAGLDTGGFVSGYRGSPLGGLDHALWKAAPQLAQRSIVFQPGLNEELAASMVWGSQQAALSPGMKKDGVFGLWYGKGPGVDRAMDALKHANAAGTSAWGGVLAIAGDDHAARSSTMPHQSDHMFIGAMMPTLAPSDPQEFLDLGLHGYAMSRYSGCWVAMLAVADTVESGCIVDVDPARVSTLAPTQVESALPEGGVSIRWPDDKMEQERRLQDVKVYAALAYARKNGLNKIHGAKSRARLGIVSCGKAWRDALQALDDLGIGQLELDRLGIRLLKLGMSWPLESEIVKEFAEGLEEILVVEEKRPIIEYLIKEQLYNWEGAKRPKVIGKFDEKGEWALPHGEWLLPARGELTPADVALAIASRIAGWDNLGSVKESLSERVAFLRSKRDELKAPVDAMARAPHYCAGCPHNRSTKVPEGSRALAGIGCHFMATWIAPGTETVSQMGGEGVGWLGMRDFTSEKHVFANLGDGTFWHSGSLAIRQSIAGKARVTYKLLHNDAVAMTGGQPVEGGPGPLKMLWAIHAEGPASIDISAEDEGRWQEWSAQGLLPPGARIHPREAMDRLQEELREREGVSILFFDQTCASEKRRRRKRGKMEKAKALAWINPEVCEGCGDCSKKSGCIAIEPLETTWGRKRAIDQHACNQDLSCVEGFCPAFVTIEPGADPKAEHGVSISGAPRAAQGTQEHKGPPEPVFAWSQRGEWNIVVAGVGGAGVVTLAQVLGMAASISGLDVSTIDQTGLAQKGGAVTSHVRLARKAGSIKAARVPDGECDLLLASDLPTACLKESLSKMSRARSCAVGSSDVAPSSAFIQDGALDFKAEPMMRQVEASCSQAWFGPARARAVDEFGEEIAMNFMLAGRAWQMGLLPIPKEAIMRAIELNGAMAQMNQQAFEAGRSMEGSAPAKAGFIAAVGLDALRKSLDGPSWDEQMGKARAWGGAQAEASHEEFKAKLGRIESGSSLALSKALRRVGSARAKLALYKDEYEVARLHVESTKLGARAATGFGKVSAFHFAPPLWPGNPASKGVKLRMPAAWAWPALKALAACRGIRGSWLDPFVWSSERKMERADAAAFEADVERLGALLAQSKAGEAERAKMWERLARTGQGIKGYGHVKARWRALALAERSEIFGEK